MRGSGDDACRKVEIGAAEARSEKGTDNCAKWNGSGGGITEQVSCGDERQRGRQTCVLSGQNERKERTRSGTEMSGDRSGGKERVGKSSVT